MCKKKYSDLPGGLGIERIIIVQPDLTTMFEKEDFLRGGDFLITFEKVLEFRELVHVCSTSYYKYRENEEGPHRLHPCGGMLSLRRPTKSDPSFLRKDLGFLVSCSNPKCEMSIGFPKLNEEAEIRNLMLHLMLKQIMPSMKTCNYADFSWVGPSQSDNISPEELEKIERVGLISIASEYLWGMITNTYFRDISVGWYSLGFMLMGDMKTLDGFDGFDSWVRFLLEQKFQLLEEQHKKNKSTMLGPKPRTK